MRKTVLMPAVAAAALFTFAQTAGAQVFTPSYQSPVVMNDLGVYLSDSQGSTAVEGIWRSGPVGLRLGYLDYEEDGLVSVGGELRMPLSAPVDIAVTAGAQGLIGDVDAIGLQAGLSVGHRFVSPGIALTPYIHPRLSVIDSFAENDDWEADLLAEVGLDAEFSRNLILRVSAGLTDDAPNIGVGVSWRR